MSASSHNAIVVVGLACLVGGITVRWGWTAGMIVMGALILFPFIMDEIKQKD